MMVRAEENKSEEGQKGNFTLISNVLCYEKWGKKG